ncbi:MAG: hypothetical protein A2W68_18150 [Betaproteobacteria bacterium RIFCSPLOWO2_02_64_14]|nr:MAG: hypothetical protein A2W68_18150 [Betaproteobacteria bacterium RIFCSPLOWO2_02_64_14]
MVFFALAADRQDGNAVGRLVVAIKSEMPAIAACYHLRGFGRAGFFPAAGCGGVARNEIASVPSR